MKRRKKTIPSLPPPYYQIGQSLIARQPCLCGSITRRVVEDLGRGFVRITCDCGVTWTCPGTTDAARAQTLLGAA